VRRRLSPSMNNIKLLPQRNRAKGGKVEVQRPRGLLLNRFAAFGDLSASVRNIVLNLVVVSVTLGAVIALAREIGTPLIVIGAVQVPDDLLKAGITPEAAAQRLMGQLQMISESSETTMLKDSAMTQQSQARFQVPVAGVDFWQLARMLKQVIKRNDTEVTGEIVHTSTGLEFRASINGPGGVGKEVRAKVPDQNLGELFRLAGEEVQRVLSPYVLASSFASIAAKECVDKPKRDCDFSRAIALFKLILTGSPTKEHQWAFLGWSWVLSRQGKHEEAAEMAQRAAEVSGPFAAGYNSWGASLADLGRHDEAIEKFRMAEQIDPGDTRTLMNWGDALGAKKDWAQADEKYALATGQQALRAEAFARWGTSLLERNHPKEAASRYRQALRLDPNHPIAGTMLAISLASSEDFAQAHVVFERMELLRPLDAWQIYMWGKALLKQKRWSDAFEKFEAAKNASPHQQWTYIAWARGLIDSGKRESGMQLLRSAAKFPLDGKAELCRTWGIESYNAGDFLDARAAFTCAIEEEPSNPRNWVDLGDTNALDHAESAALDNYRQALQKNPHFAEAHKRIGMVSFARSDYVAALTYLEGAAKLDSTDGETMRYWGLTLVGQKLFEKALAKFEVAERLRPNDELIQLDLGAALADLGRHREALGRYRRALALNPAYWQAHFNIGAELWGDGLRDEAKASYAKAVEHGAVNDPQRLACLRLPVAVAPAVAAKCAS
jgi:tetratricopeptide (TPR) repeat protein